MTEESSTFVLAFDEWLPRRPPSTPFRYHWNAFISGSSITFIGRGHPQLRPFSVESKPTSFHIRHYSSPGKPLPMFPLYFLISYCLASKSKKLQNHGFMPRGGVTLAHYIPLPYPLHMTWYGQFSLAASWTFFFLRESIALNTKIHATPKMKLEFRSSVYLEKFCSGFKFNNQMLQDYWACVLSWC